MFYNELAKNELYFKLIASFHFLNVKSFAAKEMLLA
jgi:hypothetical protein